MYVLFTADLDVFLYNLRHFFSLADYVDGSWSHTVTKTQGVTWKILLSFLKLRFGSSSILFSLENIYLGFFLLFGLFLISLKQ